jgi:hypothetical protein
MKNRKNGSLYLSTYPQHKKMASSDNPPISVTEIWNKIIESLEEQMDDKNSNV